MRLVAVILMILCAGCATTSATQARNITRARSGLAYTAQAVESVDRVTFAPRFQEVVDEILEDDITTDDEAEVLRRWVIAARSIATARSSIVSGQTTIDAIEAGMAGDPLGVVACVLMSLTQVTEALPTVGVRIPEAVTVAIAFIQSLAGPMCTTPEVTQ